MQKRKRKLGWIVPVAVIALTVCAFFVYVGVYSHADATAEAALVSDAAVSVSRTEYGWFFDGASAETEMVFYPG